MHTEKREDPLVELGYEVRDLNSKALLSGSIGFFIFAIGSSIAGFIIFRLMYPVGFETPAAVKRMMPPADYPMVQSNIAAKADIMDVRQHEDQVLNAPIHWKDASKTKLAIPIDRAMQIIAERGMPKTSPDVPAISKGHTPNPAIGEIVVPGVPSGITLRPLTGTSGGPISKSNVAKTGTSAPVSAPPQQKKN